MVLYIQIKQMKIFGNKDTFSIIYKGISEGLVEADVFVSGINITPIDNWHYDQYLINNAIETELNFFIKKVNWFRYENEIVGECIADKFSFLLECLESEDECRWELMSRHRVFDWSPCTEGSIAVVIPHFDRLYLASNVNNQIGYSKIKPYFIAKTLIDFQSHVLQQSKNSSLKLHNSWFER